MEFGDVGDPSSLSGFEVAAAEHAIAEDEREIGA